MLYYVGLIDLNPVGGNPPTFCHAIPSEMKAHNMPSVLLDTLTAINPVGLREPYLLKSIYHVRGNDSDLCNRTPWPSILWQ